MNAEPRRINFGSIATISIRTPLPMPRRWWVFGAVALPREDDVPRVLPLIGAAADGYMIKQINARGDRAIHAAAGSFILLRLFAPLGPTQSEDAARLRATRLTPAAGRPDNGRPPGRAANGMTR